MISNRKFANMALAALSLAGAAGFQAATAAPMGGMKNSPMVTQAPPPGMPQVGSPVIGAGGTAGATSPATPHGTVINTPSTGHSNTLMSHATGAGGSPNSLQLGH